MATNPVDYLSGLGGLQSLPNWGNAVQQGQDHAIDQQGAKQQLAIGAARLAAASADQEHEAAYKGAVKDYFAAPAPQKLASIMARFPDKQAAIKAAHDVQDEAKNRADLGQMVTIRSALANGKPDLAVQSLTARIAAEKAAGADTADDQQILDAIQSGDPAAMKTVQGVIDFHIASTNKDAAKALGIGGGADKFSNTPQGDIYNKETGERFSYSGGGGPASTGAPSGPTVGGVPVTASTPFASVKQRIINHEAPDAVGGYNALAYNVPGGKNGAGLTPVNLTGMTIGQVYDYQKGPMRAATKGQRGKDDIGSTGVGAYQFESGTLAQNAAKTFGKDWRDQPFTPENQDKIAEMLWNDVRGSPAKLANTWAAFKDQMAAPKPSQLAHADPTVEFYASKVAAGGDLPKLGSGKDATALRIAILKRSAELQSGQGVSGAESNVRAADAKSSGMALTQLQKTRTNVESFERTALLNADQVLKLAPAGVGGSAPIFNRWIQAGRKSVAGDPALAKFQVAINALASENAKIMSGASGGAVTSDSARHEAMEILNSAQSLPQLQGAIAQMKIDMHNRIVGLNEQETRLKGNIRGGPASASNAPQPPKPGSVVKGYRFKGGNPAQPTSWVKI